jgi:hypothetical protein
MAASAMETPVAGPIRVDSRRRARGEDVAWHWGRSLPFLENVRESTGSDYKRKGKKEKERGKKRKKEERKNEKKKRK